MRFILNVLWFIFGSGFVLALGYGLAALICFVLIVTIPFGIASLRLAVYSLWPFGRTAGQQAGRRASPSGSANIVWVVVAGWWLALTHIVAGIAQCLTIIGIPFGIANFKLVPAAFWPLGREIVDVDRPRGIRHGRLSHPDRAPSPNPVWVSKGDGDGRQNLYRPRRERAPVRWAGPRPEGSRSRSCSSGCSASCPG